jgi:hypothetical protein
MMSGGTTKDMGENASQPIVTVQQRFSLEQEMRYGTAKRAKF